MVITMRQVINLDNIEVYRISGNEHYFKCPVCGRLERKCSYNPTKGQIRDGQTCGVWRCFHCDSHGDPISLHAAVNGWTYESARDDLLGKDTAKVLSRDTYRKPENNVHESKKADPGYIAKVYRDMLDILPLSKKHEADLKKRGLTEKDIKDFHFTDAPTNGTYVAERLMNRGFELKGVPGFYKNGLGDMTVSGVKSSGYLCPVVSPDRKVCGFQKRLDSPKDGNKYVWLSSSGREDGVSSGAPSTILRGTVPGIVIVTEGILKATVTYCLLGRRFTVIGVPGVKSLGGLRSMIKEGIIGKDDLLVEAYDMDKTERTEEAFKEAYKDREEKHKDMSEDDYRAYLDEKQKQIHKDEITLQKVLRTASENVIPLSWDNKGGKWNGRYKGIDDMLLNEGAPKALYDFLLYKKATVCKTSVSKTA